MNCQDIARLVDSGKFSTLTAKERSDAEAHALSCQHCAPLWIMHASVAATRVPAVPVELSVRCLTLAAAGAHASAQRRASRRLMFVVGGLVALAAAASMLLINVSTDPVERLESFSAPPPADVPAQTLLPDQEIPPSAPVPATPPPVAVQGTGYSLPLLPAPVVMGPQQFDEQTTLAMRTALDLYPEITNGPEIQGNFVVLLALRADGTVLSNSMVIANNEEEVNAEMRKLKPLGGSPAVDTGASKGSRAPDGRILRGKLNLGFTVVPDSYDPSKSDTRVQEIVRAERAHLLMPLSNAGLNTLTVLLSEDGSIQRENVEFIGVDGLQQMARLNGPEDADARAKDMAKKLGIAIEQVGLMGSTNLQDGSRSDPASIRMLKIDYVWVRKAGETAPMYGQGDTTSKVGKVNPSDALAIVERMLPEAFMLAGRVTPSAEANSPAIVLSAEGKVLGTGRVNMRTGFLDFQRIVPGIEISMAMPVTVTNSAGQRASVQFAWEASPAQKLELEKIRKAASSR